MNFWTGFLIGIGVTYGVSTGIAIGLALWLSRRREPDVGFDYLTLVDADDWDAAAFTHISGIGRDVKGSG